MSEKKPKASDAFYPADWEIADAKAMQQLAAGTATPEQQKRALNWIIYNAARTYDLPFRPGGLEGARDTDLACGRMFVGQQIVKLINIDILAIQQKQKTKE